MTSVEKRRSGRKSGKHRKHSDTSSAGSFLDETDREVSSLTDRAFRSLCIGDEAVYNDSDLCTSSPCTQRDRQLAFSQRSQGGDSEDREREELMRAAHESFSLRMQQYGQDWIHRGMYGAEIQRDPQWEVYGEKTQGRVSATFQRSLVETSQQEDSLREEQLSFLSNGTTELSSQQRRSRSRVSSLIRAFNSEGQRDGAGMDGKLREWNDETSWDKSALMSIQRELSEFSASYQENFNNGYFPSAGPFSHRDTNIYSSEVAAVAHMNSASSFMRSSHSKHSMSEQVNCNSNFFIHSEFSPFKVWRDHNRFPFQQRKVSGFMHYSEFPKWYETPMYKELSLEAQPQGPYKFEARGIRQPRNKLAPVIPPTPPRSTSTSTVLQKALAVEKRCESELLGHYPHRKRTQSLGTNRLQSQRPSTASPTIEMSQRVQDTISSVKALQQKIKMMTQQNITTGMTENQQGVLCSNDNLIPFGNNANTVAPNVVSSNSSTTPFNTNQLPTPLVHAHQEAETSEVRQYAASPPPVEHPPVRAESRGATPDVRMSSYKSKATSLLFNLKDNRKRVKSTYSPTKFKGLETPEKNKQPSIQEPRDIVIDIPDYPDPDIQFPHIEESSRTNASSHQYANQYYSPGLSTLNYQPATALTGQYSQYTSSDYQTAQIHGEMVHHSGFTGFIPENYSSNQLANGQNLHEDLSSFTPYKQGMVDNVETLGGNVNRVKQSYTATETPRLNADNKQTREYLISKANTEQHFNETVGREFTKVDRYQQLKDNKHDYSNVSSQDRWRQTNSQDTKNLNLKATISPWKQEINALMEKDQHVQAYQRAVKEEPIDNNRGDNQQSINKDLEKTELRENFGVGTSHRKTGWINTNLSNQQYAPFRDDSLENPAYNGKQQTGAFNHKYELQMNYGHNKDNEIKDNYLTKNYNRYNDQEYRNQHILYSNKDKAIFTQEADQRKQYTPIPAVHKMQSLQQIEEKPQFEHNMQTNSLSNPDNASAPTMENWIKDEVKAKQAMAEDIKAHNAQAELANAHHWAQGEQPGAESPRLILAGQTCSEKVKEEQAKAELTDYEGVNQAKTEHINKEKRKEQTELAGEDQTEAEQTRVQLFTEEPRNITEETGAEHTKEQQVKAELAEAERLKEELIKTELAKPEQAGQAIIKQTKTEQVKKERLKAERLEEEQVKAEQVERKQTEQIRTEKVKAEQVEAESRKVEVEQIKEQQAQAEQKKAKAIQEETIQVDQVNAEQPTKQIRKAKEEKVKERTAEWANLKQTKVELATAERTKTENMQERLAKPAAKLIEIQVQCEPDKVEQVKSELAKAKAELAKIKEKMRGEQKEKVRNTALTREDMIKKDVPLRVNVNKNDKYKDQDQGTQMHQQREDSVIVRKQSPDQANREADDYKYLREKYGFTDTTSTNRNKLSAAGNVSSNDSNETLALSLHKVETMNGEKSKDKHSPISKFANSDIKEEVSSFKSNEVTESHYVYSESSKEFKLSDANYLPTNLDKRAKSDTVNDKVKDESVKKLDPLKQTVSQQKHPDLAKPLPLERKPKSTEPCAGPGKDPHFTPPRALSHKERAQTKQEILTSKIKAHAEKEISAIKEKGFALRDGFISKNSAKQLAGSQGINARQRPPSQGVSKKQESTMSSNRTPKYQMEPSRIQKEPVKSVSPPSSATIPVKSAETTSQLVDHLQKEVPKESMKSNDNLPELPREAKKTGSYTMSTAEGLVENLNNENQSGIKSPKQSKHKNKQEKQEVNHVENSGKPTEGLKDNPVDTDHLNKKKEDPSQVIPLVEVESSKPMTTEKAESKLEAVHEDLASSLNIVFGQNKTSVADDSLQITGIMVTVRERKPPVNLDQRDNSTEEQINVKERECSNSQIDECHSSSDLEINNGNKSSKEVAKNTHPTAKEDQTKPGIDIHPKNVQQMSDLETRQNNVSENVTVKESSSTNARSQRETHQQEPLAEKSVSSTVTVAAQNKVLSETSPILPKQDIIIRENKDYTNKTLKENSTNSIKKDEIKTNTEETHSQKNQIAYTNKNFVANVMNTGLNYTDDSNRAEESLVKLDIQPSMKEDMTAVINPPKSRNIDDKRAPLQEENRHESTPSRPLNKTSLSNHLTNNENRQVENNKVNDSVHIDSIAIRVVPAVIEKNNPEMLGKHHITTVPFDVVAANEHKQVASSSCEEQVNTSNNEDRTKDLNPASNDKPMEDSLEDKVGVQCVLSDVRKLSDSLKISNQQNSIEATSENTQDGSVKLDEVNGGRKSVDDSMEGGYFQVQGMAETNHEPNNGANVGDTLGSFSKGLPPNKVVSSNESYNNVSALDESKRKTVESSSVRVQDQNMKRKNRETEDDLALKQSNGPTERQSNKNEKSGAAQAIHIRKHHTETQSSLSARERQSCRNSHPTSENTEKAEVKPKPKDRVSTIPDISAIADYARLKVIVSEDQANTIQEFPPNKKEGFFPLIQTRHSRRPVFTADPQDLSVKGKSLPKKTEVYSKVHKEPKPLVFPIMEKEHQRTGMFKLGDKEKQEKLLLDAKANEGALDTGAKHAQHVKERNKSPTTHLKNQTREAQVAETNAQRVFQGHHQSNNPFLEATHSFSAANRPRNTSESHLKPLDNSNQHEKYQDSSKAERIAYFDKHSHQQPISGQVYSIEGSTTTLENNEKIENALNKIGDEKTENLRQERLAKQQSKAQQLEEEQASRAEEEKRAENMKIKHIIDESRASLAEEERRAAQREDERRAREREAIAIKIKERREKQKEEERRAEEKRKTKQTEEGEAIKNEERAKRREEQRRMKETDEKRRIKIEEERRAKLREEEERIKENEERRRAKQREEKRAAQEEQPRRAAQEEQQRRAAQEEQQRRAAQEQQQRRAAQEEQQRRAAQEEQQRRAAQEEQQRRAAQEEQPRRAAQEEQQRRAAQEEQQKRAAQEEQQKRAAQEEQQRRAAQEEQQRRAAYEEQKRRAAQEEQQRRSALEEQHRRAALEEQKRKAALEEQQRRAAHEEQKRKAALEEQQRRAAHEEQKRKAALEEQQRRAALEEQKRKAALEEQQRRASHEEQKRRAAQEQQQRRAAQEEQQRRAAQEEQQRRAAQEEEQRRAAQEEQQRRAAQEEQQRRAAQEEQHKRAAQEEQQKRAAQEEQQWRAALIETQAKEIKENTLTDIEEEKIKDIQKQKTAEQQTEEQRGEREKKEEWMRTQRDEERRAVEKEKTTGKQKEENPVKEERIPEESQAALKKEETRQARDRVMPQREDKIRAQTKGEEEEKLATYREKERDIQMEEHKRAAQRLDALQYYAINSSESERKPKERPVCSPLPSQQKNNPIGMEPTEDTRSHARPYRPHAPASPAPSLHAPASPAPSLPRSNTSSPALGAKPSMFRVKDNTFRGPSFTRSVKPRFHKNFGEDFRVGSPMERGLERGEEEQESMRRNAGTPVYADTGLTRLAAIKESSTFQPASLSQEYSAPLPQHRPYSRRSIALDEDDSRSVISNMSEDVESFATSVADLADVRGLYDHERPESACSFSSDVSRSLGKPPTVPPKSDKALRRAKRLTTRRIKKELSKAVADITVGVEKPLQVSNIPSSSTEVRSSNRHAMASPHFSPPVSLANAPTFGSNLPSSHKDHQSSHCSFHASPHATGPISLPIASPHATPPVSLPVSPPHAAGPASHPVAPKTVAHVPSSPTLHHANHPAPVTQYHVESSYPQSYPLTQRKVLQDLGSGQYFVVDVPVQVKTKTFIDPQTGKYVQLNVREAAQGTSRPQPQQTYLQPQLQPQVQVKPQKKQLLSQTSPAGKPVLYEGYHGYPKGYQHTAISSVPGHGLSAPVTLHQDQQLARESHSCGYPAPEMGQNSEGHRYSPEKTPYMDTVNDTDKTYNTVYNTNGPYESLQECDTNSQIGGSSICENNNSQYQPRDIITISELEDFMEVSDW